MQKIKRLTEMDINRLVKKVLTEDTTDMNMGEPEFVIRDIGCGEEQEVSRYDIDMNSEKGTPQIYIEYCRGNNESLQKLKDAAMRELNR